MEQENLQSTEKAGISIKVEKRFRIWYMGWSSLDSRVTMPMLPWLMAEIRRRSEKSEAGATQQREVLLSLTPPLVRCVPATNNSSSSVFIFEHKAHNIFKFIRNSHDLTYFAYLIRTQPDNPESEMACHVFKACDPEQVSEVISSIRQISKAALKEDPKPKEESEDAFYNSQKFEVLFCGKVTVSHKNVPSTVIDDCIEKFRQYEVESKQLKLLNKQKGSAESHVNFLIGDVDPLTSQDDGSLDVQEGDIVSGSPSGTLPSNTSQTSLFGSLGAFPECILEDSGFDDQQEFRTRCNSTAAVMQKKVSDNNLKGGVRRRHASAPSHVQPSDSDKNRTMLFQVNEVMMTLKQAFSTASALQNAKTQIKLCEDCPMHLLHKLCERIEGLYPPRAKLIIQRHLSILNDKEQADIFERVQNAPNTAVPENVGSIGRFKLDILKNKAKKSLTSSLENIFSRGANRMRSRLGSMDSFERSSSLASEKALNYVGGMMMRDGTPPHTATELQAMAVYMDENPFDGNELLPLSPVAPALDEDPLLSLLPTNVSSDGQVRKRTSEELRDLWRKAIHQQILLLRMEKENQRLEASRDELQSRKIKLDYQEVGQCPMEVLAIWEKKLSIPSRSKVRFDMEEIYSVLSQGVPKNRRGEIWQFLAAQYRLRHRLPCKQQPPDISYKDLLKQLTAQQHAILVDLGRTFPTHQYFSTQLGAGQLSLFNLLKAYSLLDKEVGYCQGISFVAGVLLLHMSEHQAFEMLKFLMYDLGFRKQYKPDMISLQIQMYQLSRLLHDYHRDLYDHLEGNDITPSLYAAPWFLTLFASQFQLNFVARVFGTEVILKIALSLLSSHESRIMECDGFESIVDFMKNTIPNLTVAHMEKIVAQVFEMDISKQLHAYEVEYHVLHEEMLDSSLPYDSIDRLDKLERTNNQLKRQNMDLLENLQAARAKIQSLEASLDSILSRESKMKQLIRSLEQEKAAYQKTIERMQSYLPTEALSDIELTEFTFSSNSKGKLGNKKP
ncbi:TBCD4 protein, partial [Polypterus senegalus]